MAQPDAIIFPTATHHVTFPSHTASTPAKSTSSPLTGSETSPMDALIFAAMKSSIQLIIKAEILGVFLQAIILGCVLVQTSNYFRLFNSTDPRLYKISVGFGTTLCVTQMVFTTYAALSLIDHASDFTAYFHKDLSYTMAVVTFLCIFRGGALVYFSRRLWSLTGRKVIILGLLIIALIGCTALGVIVSVYGYQAPTLKSFADVQDMVKWYDNMSKWSKSWAIVCPAIDLVVCAATIVGLLQTSWGLRGSENRLLRKVVILTTETMIPPTLFAVAILIFFEVKGLLSSYDRSLIWAIGPLYFYTALHSLVARQQLAAVIYAPASDHAPRQPSTDLRSLRLPISRPLSGPTGLPGELSPIRTDKPLEQIRSRQSQIRELPSLEYLQALNIPVTKASFDTSTRSKNDYVGLESGHVLGDDEDLDRDLRSNARALREKRAPSGESERSNRTMAVNSPMSDNSTLAEYPPSARLQQRHWEGGQAK